MAYYKNANHLKQYDGKMFESVHTPGEKVPFSGVYRCEGCGKELSHNATVALPARNHHPHKPEQGDIRWKLIVWAVT